jgi:HD-GYP domain-containing protein (c-di-GMP phosphodiesterase class II)/DNA-binding CsgD family transcriptional regulator
MAMPRAVADVRLAELLAVMAFGADLGMGQPMEHATRQCVLALRIGDRLGLDDDARGVLYYVSLVAWVGCHIDAYEQAKWFGDDLAMKEQFRHVDPVGIRAPADMISMIGRGRGRLDRAGMVLRFFAGGTGDAAAMLANHAYAADQLGAALGLSAQVRAAVSHTFERWDGRGEPEGHTGEEISLAARIVNLSDVLAVFHLTGGPETAVQVATKRSGTQFDPSLVDLVRNDSAMLFADLDQVATWPAIIDAEPALERPLLVAEFDNALTALGDFVDIKSPYTLGHTRAVAGIAETAATVMGWPSADVDHVQRAALVHDLGRLGVSNAIWDKTAELSASEAERVRLHPYLTDRMLAGSPALAALGSTAAQHHERLDGSGYPRGLRGDALTPAGRLLAVADTFVAKTEPRPHRPALSQAEAAAYVRAEARAGRLDPVCVDAVLSAAGQRVGRRRDWPSGLTAREVEVLRLLARGLSNKEIAERLVIARKTADNHIEHIYAKIGVSNRARASLFAVRNGLIAPTDDGSLR